MTKVSICVPVYNVEQYIGRCLDSLVSQTFKDIEIIVVNDCTPDKSMKIVGEYAKEDDRIKIINHDKNLGLMWTRRTGYIAAKGDYITFCDSDDTLPIDAIETLYNIAMETQADITSGNISYIQRNGNVATKRSFLKHGTDKISVFKSLLLGEYAHNLCSKLFSKRILQKYQYKTYEHFVNGEDGCLFYQVVDNSYKIVHIENSVYNYFHNSESSTNVIYNDKAIESIVLLNQMRQTICKKYTELEILTDKKIVEVVSNLCRSGYKKRLRKIMANENMKGYLNPWNFSTYFSFTGFIKILVKVYFPFKQL